MTSTLILDCYEYNAKINIYSCALNINYTKYIATIISLNKLKKRKDMLYI